MHERLHSDGSSSRQNRTHGPLSEVCVLKVDSLMNVKDQTQLLKTDGMALNEGNMAISRAVYRVARNVSQSQSCGSEETYIFR